MHPSRIRTLIATGIVVLLFIGAHSIGWLSPVEHGIQAIFSPVIGGLYSVSDKVDKNIFTSKDELAQRYNELVAVYNEVLSRQAQDELTHRENSELREQLHFFEKKSYTHIGADVVGKNIETHSNTIVVNRGRSDGVSVGDPVLSGQGILVGKVRRVEPLAAVVQLLNDEQSKIAAIVVNETESPGIVEGGYNISVRMKFIPQNETLKIGDIIVTSGLEERIPKGLVIGRVEAVIKEAYQPFQEAIITPAGTLERLSVVSILVANRTP